MSGRRTVPGGRHGIFKRVPGSSGGTMAPTPSEASGVVDRVAVPSGEFLTKYGKFLLVGLTGVVVNLIVFALTLDATSPSPTFNLVASLLHFASTRVVNPLDDFLASAVAFGVATLWNFLINNLWTFRSTSGHRHPFSHRLGLYYGVSLASLGVNELVLFAMGFYVSPLFAQGIGIITGSVVGFAGNYRVTFAQASPGSVPRGPA
ncbi:MAG TPA: GtrA family protein [Thermoplasmata archaeon]|nr:GtrA family protein [Thermoplasmata archaeon]